MRSVTPSSFQATGLPPLRATAARNACSDCSSRPVLRYRMPRLISAPANCGYAAAICWNSSSASVALPVRIMPTARSKSAVARRGTSTGGALGAAAPAVAAEAVPAGVGTAAGCWVAGTAALGGSVRSGVLLQAQSSTASAAGAAGLVDLSDHILRQLRLAVARGLELRERDEALAHPFVIH